MSNFSNHFTAVEVARMAAVHEATIYNYVRDGKIAAENVNGHWFIEKDEAFRFLGKSKVRKHNYYTTADLCRLLSMSSDTVCKSAQSGIIPAKKFGAAWFFDKAPVDKLVSESSSIKVEMPQSIVEQALKDAEEVPAKLTAAILALLEKKPMLSADIINTTHCQVGVSTTYVRNFLKNNDGQLWNSSAVNGVTGLTKLYRLIKSADKPAAPVAIETPAPVAIETPVKQVVIEPLSEALYPTNADYEKFIYEFIREECKPIPFPGEQREYVFLNEICKAGAKHFGRTESCIHNHVKKGRRILWERFEDRQGIKIRLIAPISASVEQPVLETTPVVQPVSEPVVPVNPAVPVYALTEEDSFYTKENGVMKEYVSKDKYSAVVQHVKALETKLSKLSALRDLLTF